MADYCLWKSNCILLKAKKLERDDVNNYLCCYSCSNRSCVYRCTDNKNGCKYTCEKDYVKQVIEKGSKLFVDSSETPFEKQIVNKIPKVDSNTLHNLSNTVEHPVAPKQIVNNLPHNKKELAKLLGVSYDKVAYRIEVKHMTYEDVYKELKK